MKKTSINLMRKEVKIRDDYRYKTGKVDFIATLLLQKAKMFTGYFFISGLNKMCIL